MTKLSTDFSNAEPSGFDTIPDGTEVPVIFKVQAGDIEDGCIKVGKTGSLMLNLEATVTGGKYAKRKVFFGFYMGREDGELTDGQQTAVDMSRSKLRSILEAARGVSATDETPAAIKARAIKSWRDLDGLECSVILGVEEGTGTFSDKNVLKRVVGVGKENKAAQEAGATASASKAAAKKGW